VWRSPGYKRKEPDAMTPSRFRSQREEQVAMAAEDSKTGFSCAKAGELERTLTAGKEM
jgi:hypothetical protein